MFSLERLQKDFGSEEILSLKKVVKKNFGWKFFWFSTHIDSQHILGPKKISGPKKMLAKKIFWGENIFVSEINRRLLKIHSLYGV